MNLGLIISHENALYICNPIHSLHLFRGRCNNIILKGAGDLAIMLI
jgi:hypothetical protein